MIVIKHTTPGRVLGHLRRLQRDGEALLALPRFLTVVDEGYWEIRVWKCLDKIVTDRRAFDLALERDMEDIGGIRLEGPKPPDKMNRLLRRRITRRLGTLASVIEKVEAQVEQHARQ
jgi:hypothetical protein